MSAAADTPALRPRAARGGGRRRRTLARLAAVQALYQRELNSDLTPEAVVAEFAQHRLGREIEGEGYGKADAALFADIVLGAAKGRERLDDAISTALTPDWPLARLESVLRAILRAGAYELLERPDVPARVAIDEYTTIAHAFFAGKEPGLANGVLDRLGRMLRPAEF
jgi:transcription antitermination protein NusB